MEVKLAEFSNRLKLLRKEKNAKQADIAAASTLHPAPSSAMAKISFLSCRPCRPSDGSRQTVPAGRTGTRGAFSDSRVHRIFSFTNFKIAFILYALLYLCQGYFEVFMEVKLAEFSRLSPPEGQGQGSPSATRYTHYTAKLPSVMAHPPALPRPARQRGPEGNPQTRQIPPGWWSRASGSCIPRTWPGIWCWRPIWRAVRFWGGPWWRPRARCATSKAVRFAARASL